ncbi:hypothetical protein CEP54_015613 [Fusarium duplospermum]|uniref:Uncharacterized protein n=1 Tax=Fusarium duplospermum TaxID=1325734 RepID=A0A428NMU9_9HYPO|nr:hypothetical protein CEP54_015613 [Fusarium duplospermum]
MGSSRHKHRYFPKAPPNLSATLPRQSKLKPKRYFQRRWKIAAPFQKVRHDYQLPATYSQEDHQYVRHKKARRGRLTADYGPEDHYQPEPVPPDEDDSESSPCQDEETSSDDDSDQGQTLLSHAYFEHRMQDIEESVGTLSTQLKNLDSKLSTFDNRFSDFDNRLAAFGSKVESLAKK